MSNTLNIVSTL